MGTSRDLIGRCPCRDEFLAGFFENYYPNSKVEGFYIKNFLDIKLNC